MKRKIRTVKDALTILIRPGYCLRASHRGKLPPYLHHTDVPCGKYQQLTDSVFHTLLDERLVRLDESVVEDDWRYYIYHINVRGHLFLLQHSKPDKTDCWDRQRASA